MSQSRVAIITGGASGIGYYIAKILLQNYVEKLYIFDLSTERGNEAVRKLNSFGENRIAFKQVNVSNASELKGAIDHVVAVEKRLDLYLNNAGTTDDSKIINLNFIATLNGLKYAMEHMSTACGGNGGTIVNIASILGLTAWAGCPLYTATKHAVIGMTKSYGLPYHYKQSNVRVMALCPGITSTNMVVNYLDEKVARTALQLEMIREAQSLPSQSPEHVAASLLKVLQVGTSGSIWIVENGESPYEIEQPHYSTLRKK